MHLIAASDVFDQFTAAFGPIAFDFVTDVCVETPHGIEDGTLVLLCFDNHGAELAVDGNDGAFHNASLNIFLFIQLIIDVDRRKVVQMAMKKMCVNRRCIEVVGFQGGWPLNGGMLMSQTLELPGVRHGFFTREGGVSTGIYASLNCGPGSHDDSHAVAQNRLHTAQALGLNGAKLVTCHQIHSPTTVRVDVPWDQSQAPKADAMVTNQPGLILGILTADCAPVLFADVEASVVGAAHAGWKGAAGGVLQATVSQMIELGAKKENIHAAVGPCIHQSSYEVGAQMRLQVISRSAWADWCFERSSRPDHYQFDLPSYVSGELQRLDLGKVEVIDCDTYSDEQRFFSYRRTTHRGEGDYGRQISVIGLEG